MFFHKDHNGTETPNPVQPTAGKKLSADNTVEEWLDDPIGGVIFRNMLEKAGQDEKVLRLVRRFSLKKLQGMSKGQMSDDILNDMIHRQNTGELPGGIANAAANEVNTTTEPGTNEPIAQTPYLPSWKEKVTPDRFKGKTIIVTGAGSGIGHATASRVAREAGHVIAVDIAEDRLNELLASLPRADIIAVVADITKQEDIEKIIRTAGEHIHGLANIAGIMDSMLPLGELDDATWDRVLGVNLTGMVKLSRTALPKMLPLDTASIVNISAEAGFRGSAAGVAATASKHAVIGVTKNTAFMYGPQGLRVNAVAPGGTATNIDKRNDSKLATKRMSQLFESMPDIADPEQIAASITFLLSDDSTNINGVVLPSDGGWSAQ